MQSSNDETLITSLDDCNANDIAHSASWKI